MATLQISKELSSSSLVEGASNPDPAPDADQAVNQVPNSSGEADVASDPAQLDSSLFKDGADLSTLQYPAVETSMEPSSSPVMYF